jgi:uncharacterized membrane protein
MVAISTVFLIVAQTTVGAALAPGLNASGFIVLAIGSVYILKEHLKAIEIIAIIILIAAITLIGFSQLSITANISIFSDINFDWRIGLYSLIFTGLWLGFYYWGKVAKKFKSLLLAIGTGFPFVVGNLWLQPMFYSIGPVFSGSANSYIWVVFLISVVIAVLSNCIGLIHYQFALESGNASIVVPIQQIPQQIAPIFTFYFIYSLSSPQPYSLAFLIIGIVMICIAGFLLAQRQASLEKIKA